MQLSRNPRAAHPSEVVPKTQSERGGLEVKHLGDVLGCELCDESEVPCRHHHDPKCPCGWTPRAIKGADE